MPIVQHGDDTAPLTEMEPADDVEPNQMMIMSSLTLPSNATSIRADITDGFSCKNKTYGYYADVDNDCQIFHVCLPVTYADGKENTFRWSFICPEETIFSQVKIYTLTLLRTIYTSHFTIYIKKKKNCRIRLLACAPMT